MSADLRPWDGVWRVQRPENYTPGLYTMSQYSAHRLLKSRHRWTEAQARILQAIAYNTGSLSMLQRHYLERFEREAEGEVVP